MYSLYRAWFGEESYPRLESLSPPDTVVRVGNEGEHQFVAHRGVLAAHSGYLKALLATTGSTSSSREGPGNVTSVSVSSIGGEAFAPLLNYMYTGRLEVTLENIYSVLLATHLLHMPGALEQCRAALLRLRGPPPPPPHLPPAHTNTTVLRPVPSRLVGPPICWPQSGLYSPTVGLTHLPNLQLPPGLPVLQAPNIIHETATSATVCRRISPSPRPPTPQPLKHPKKSHARTKSPSAKKEKREQVKATESEKETPEKPQNQSPNVCHHPPEFDERTSVPSVESLSQRPSGRISGLSTDQGSTSATGVVLDIACCDGPVKFHRVLNENYTTPVGDLTTYPPAPRDHPERPESVSENDENGRPDRSSDSIGESSGHGCYTCEYCQHTFKSHYCYKKHARRHLLPTENETNARTDGKRREVRLLDLNVQYYPCKICGSKFPSYYFVHKHKKMCHPNEVERNSEGENSQSIPATSNLAKT
ncbi:uncharacterized protein LOC135165152 isoform X2 [Diachasmimorpha longicaudata]|uniref:uncharacterized protein LOC135165152 isoform X2 n=1 Tax=Diachasmimorpha longicaudata TaxID=58733 RepID=UPI0030B8C5AD